MLEQLGEPERVLALVLGDPRPWHLPPDLEQVTKPPLLSISTSETEEHKWSFGVWLIKLLRVRSDHARGVGKNKMTEMCKIWEVQGALNYGLTWTRSVRDDRLNKCKAWFIFFFYLFQIVVKVTVWVLFIKFRLTSYGIEFSFHGVKLKNDALQYSAFSLCCGGCWCNFIILTFLLLIKYF